MIDRKQEQAKKLEKRQADCKPPKHWSDTNRCVASKFDLKAVASNNAKKRRKVLSTLIPLWSGVLHAVANNYGIITGMSEYQEIKDISKHKEAKGDTVMKKASAFWKWLKNEALKSQDYQDALKDAGLKTRQSKT